MESELNIPAELHNPYEEVSNDEVAAVSHLQLISILLLTAVFFASRKLSLGIEKILVIGAVRGFAQITILGIILVPIILQNNPLIVLGFITVMILMAAVEVALRPSYEYQAMVVVSFLSIGISVVLNGFLVLVVALGTNLNAQYAIPITGIVIGQATESVSITLSNLVTELAEKRESIEVLLALGASRWEACADAVRSSIKLGMTPTLALMTVAGLVFVPELMTGHIISGTIPTLAADYQLIVIYIGVGSAILSATTASLLTIRILLDPQGRFRAGKLHKRNTEDRVTAIISTAHYLVSRFLRWRSNILQRGSPFPEPVERDFVGDGAGENIALVRQGRDSATYGSYSKDPEQLLKPTELSD